MVGTQPAECVTKQSGFLFEDCLGARCATIVRWADRLVALQRPFSVYISLARCETSMRRQYPVAQDRPQPCQQLSSAVASKLLDVLVRLQANALHDVRRSHLLTQLRVQFLVGHQQQIIPASLKDLIRRRLFSRPRPPNQFFKFRYIRLWCCIRLGRCVGCARRFGILASVFGPALLIHLDTAPRERGRGRRGFGQNFARKNLPRVVVPRVTIPNGSHLLNRNRPAGSCRTPRSNELPTCCLSL